MEKENLIYIVLENGKIKNVFSKDLNINITILDLDNKERKGMEVSMINISDNKLLEYINEIEKFGNVEYYSFTKNIMKRKKEQI